MDQLSERKRTILKAVIIEYVSSAEPIASEKITANCKLGVKSATIRNELAEMAELGYLGQPHTSAGRIPSDLGYRYYVDFIAEPKQTLSPHQPKPGDIREVAHETTKALSRMTRLMAAAVTLRDSQVVVKHALLTALGPHKGLLILLLDNGHSENRLIQWNHQTSLEDVAETNSALQTQVAGKTLVQLTRSKPPVDEQPTTLLGLCLAEAKNAAKDLVKGHVILEGEEFVLSQPEFVREPGSISELADALSDESAIKSGISGQAGKPHPVTIGAENPLPEHRRLSILRRSFYIGGTESGMLAIIGPTRMDYERNISVLDWSAQSISSLLTALHA